MPGHQTSSSCQARFSPRTTRCEVGVGKTAGGAGERWVEKAVAVGLKEGSASAAAAAVKVALVDLHVILNLLKLGRPH